MKSLLLLAIMYCFFMFSFELSDFFSSSDSYAMYQWTFLSLYFNRFMICIFPCRPPEYPVVPVLANYSPGTPSSRLYIKNLAKSVTLQHLRRLYDRYAYAHYGEEQQQHDEPLDITADHAKWVWGWIGHPAIICHVLCRREVGLSSRPVIHWVDMRIEIGWLSSHAIMFL